MTPATPTPVGRTPTRPGLWATAATAPAWRACRAPRPTVARSVLSTTTVPRTGRVRTSGARIPAPAPAASMPIAACATTCPSVPATRTMSAIRSQAAMKLPVSYGTYPCLSSSTQKFLNLFYFNIVKFSNSTQHPQLKNG
jgi:hypothetical protein